MHGGSCVHFEAENFNECFYVQYNLKMKTKFLSESCFSRVRENYSEIQENKYAQLKYFCRLPTSLQCHAGYLINWGIERSDKLHRVAINKKEQYKYNINRIEPSTTRDKFVLCGHLAKAKDGTDVVPS